MVSRKQLQGQLSKPVYKLIEEDLRSQVASGSLREGVILPSRALLAKHYGVGLATLERAVSVLLADGTLKAVRRQYTAVARLPQSELDSVNHRETTPLRPHCASSVPSLPNSLGVISYVPSSADEPADKLEGWLYQTSIFLERSYLQGNGVLRFASLKSDVEAPRRPMETAISELIEQDVSTVAIVDLNGSMREEEILLLPELIAKYSVLVVYISNSECEAAIPHVFYDSSYLGCQAVNYCISKGFHSFAYVSPYCFPWSVNRFNKARETAIAKGLRPDSVISLFGAKDTVGKNAGEEQHDAALEFGRALFCDDEYPRCIIAANDYTAHGLIDASHEFDLKQGIDYAIVGFDDERRSIQDGLTTFRPPLEEIGKEAAMLLTRLENGDSCGMQVRLRSQLVARASTMCPLPPQESMFGKLEVILR
ncbi:MAG: substrate-binding domain-containing protein [Capsulimonadaceae bacterium]|nr:substrate-binding domain-containing protein [Capsulimonadaceae bacterium]